MHPPHVREEAMRLIAAGVNDCEISRRMGIPRATIRDWRRPTYVPKRQGAPCPRCWRPSNPISCTTADYAELLGLYLGDGSISELARTYRLRIALDAKYPVIVAETHGLLARSFPTNQVGLVSAHGGTMFFVSLYCSHLPCLFPQHGPGPKHLRPIQPEPWQSDAIEAAPWSFLRGCIRSDGCAFINRTGPYKYLSYDFSNRSRDIIELFTAACDLVEVRYRVSQSSGDVWRVRINRRESVARMQEHVGLKT
jgi:hypothetical protein